MAPPSTKTAKPKNFKNKKNRETKVALVFDPKKRREFLTGFHKRKLQRQQTAKEQLQQQLKLEQKRLRDEAKDSFNKLVLSHKRIPELDDFLAKHEVKQEEYDDTAADGDGVTVKVVELNPNEIAFDNNWIGENTFKYQTVKKEEEEEEEEDCGNDRDDDAGVKGMELKGELQKTQQLEQKQEKKTFKSKRDIKKLLKKKATQKVKQSRVFQKKNQYERRKQLKKNRVSKRQQEKQEKRNTRKRRK